MRRTLSTGRILSAIVVTTLLSAITAASGAWARGETIRIDRLEYRYTVEADGSYVLETIQEATVTGAAGKPGPQRIRHHHPPPGSTIQLVEATVIHPDGRRVEVPPEHRRAAYADTPAVTLGLSHGIYTDIEFRELEIGSRMVSHIRESVSRPSAVGFSMTTTAPSDRPTQIIKVTFDLPEALPFVVAERGGFSITEQDGGDGRRIVTALLGPTAAIPDEPLAPGPESTRPLVMATTMRTWEEVGHAFHRQAKDKVRATAEIRETARTVAAGRSGLEAIRAIQAWIATTIRYVQVRLDHEAGYFPSPAAEVMRRGHGGSADFAMLMVSMLSVLGIEAHPALVNGGDEHLDLPAPSADQFNYVIVHVPAFDLWTDPGTPLGKPGAYDVYLAGKRVVVASDQPWTTRLAVGKPDDSIYLSLAEASLTTDGDLIGTARIEATGGFETTVRQIIADWESADALAEEVLNGTDHGGFGTLDAGDVRDLSRPLRIATTWKSERAVPLSKRFQVVPPEGINLILLDSLADLETRGPRTLPFISPTGRVVHEIAFALPSGYVAESVPTDISVANAFGSYRARYRVKDNRIIIRRDLTTLPGPLFEAAAFPEAMAVLAAIRQDLAGTITVIRDKDL